MDRDQQAAVFERVQELRRELDRRRAANRTSSWPPRLAVLVLLAAIVTALVGK